MKEHTERAGKCSLSILVDRRNAYVILILSLSSVWNSASRMILSKSLPNMLPIPVFLTRLAPMPFSISNRPSKEYP